MTVALVTGGSGFLGGRLIDRLAADGWTVRALARSDAAASRVAARGAEPVRGDVTDAASVTAAAEGCEVCFHAAARVEEWGTWDDFRAVNVGGTRTVVAACRAAGVRRLVHVGTESALMHGQPLVRVDETYPLVERTRAPYAGTKAEAERALFEGSAPPERVSVRPRLVWGPGDTTLLPAMVDAVRSGRWRWVGGGRHLTSTTHVDNAVEGLVLAAERAGDGEAYFVTDGEPVEFRAFVSALLRTAGVEPPEKDLPAGVARAVTAGGEAVWRALRLGGTPPLTRTALWLSSLECTLDDGKARRDLGYAPVVEREAGLAALAA